jgi:hypothetical protein
MGLESGASWKDILVRTQEAKVREPVKPNIVASGTYTQNEMFEGDIDLHEPRRQAP